LQQLLIGIGLGAGMTDEKAAEYAGCAPRTLYNHKKEPEIEEIRSLVSRATLKEREVYHALTAKEFASKMELLLGKVAENYDGFLSSANEGIRLAATRDVKETVVGRPKNTNLNLVAGRVDVAFHQVPQATLDLIDEYAPELGRLLNVTPKELPDGE
jgi:hypothetical protein